MAGAVIGALRVALGLDSAQFSSGATAVQKRMKALGAQIQSVGSSVTNAGKAFTAGFTVPLLAGAAAAVNEATEMRDAVGQVEAALTSMGDKGGRSMGQLKGQADKLAGSSLFEDDQILRGVTANMLTFGNVAGTQFDRAQQAALDVAARMRTDLQPATLMIGKALNAPTKGLAALGRAGIQFTEQQKVQIKSMEAAGNMAGAQSIMLSELEKQFGGSAQAARDNAAPLERMKLAFASMAGDIGTMLLPFVDRITAKFEELTGKFSKLSPEMQKFVLIGAGIAAALGPALMVIGSVISAVGTLAIAMGSGGALAGIVPFLGPIGLAVAGVAVAFMMFKDDIIPVLQAFAQSVAENVGPKIAPLFEALKNAVKAVGSVFASIFGGGDPKSASANLKVFGEIVSRVMGAAIDILTGAINTITAVFQAFGALLRGDFSAMWGYLGQAVHAQIESVVNAFRTLFPNVTASIQRMVEGVSGWLTGKLFDVLEGVIRKVRFVSDAFFKLYDAVVGHSYIPDMVTEVGQWMGQLDARMVRPAQQATSRAAEAFEAMRDRVRASMEGLLTDRERVALDYAREMKNITEQLAAGPAGGGITQSQFDLMAGRLRAQNARDNAGIDAEGLAMPDVSEPGAIGDAPGFKAIQDAWSGIQQKIHDSREAFADSFEYGINAALNGDWKGVLSSLFGDAMSDGLRNIGRSLFDKVSGGSGGGGFSFSGMLSSIFSKSPKFKNGGSILPGGAGGIDSQFVSLWKSPGEQVDIYTPGADRGGEGTTRVIVEANDDRFNAYVDGRVSPAVARSETRMRKAIPGEVNRGMATGRVGPPAWA